MLTPERHRAILRLLAERGRLTLNEMESRFGVSPATARRDASTLARARLAQRTHGGLLPPEFTLVEPRYPYKAEEASGIKAQLGRAAAALLPEAGTVFVDAGSTCLEVGRLLLDRPNLRLFTNSVPLLALANEARASVCALGGELRTVSQALTGAFALEWLKQLQFDVAVMGASGLDRVGGASTTEVAEAGLKSEALRRARVRMLVAHSEKWGRPAAIRFAPWPVFHQFVTDRAVPRSERLELEAHGVRVHIASAQ